MTYEQFREGRLKGSVVAGIDKSVAIRAVELLPKRYTFSHYFWTWAWFLSIPVFIAVAIFAKWWIGLLLLVVVTPMIYSAVKDSAAQFVMEHAENNEEFFNYLVENDLIFFVDPDTREAL